METFLGTGLVLAAIIAIIPAVLGITWKLGWWN